MNFDVLFQMLVTISDQLLSENSLLPPVKEGKRKKEGIMYVSLSESNL